MTHRLGPKGQVVIPKEMRERLGLEPGDEVAFTLEGGAVRVSPAPADRRPLRGRFAGAGALRDLEAEHRRELRREERRPRRR